MDCLLRVRLSHGLAPRFRHRPVLNLSGPHLQSPLLVYLSAPLTHFYFHGNEDCVFLTHLLPTKEDGRIYGLTEDLELVSNAIYMDEQTRLSFLPKWTQI